MELDHQNITEGQCRVAKCNHDAVAIADGKTFFSKRAPLVPLCENDLARAQEMAVQLGNDLVWHEFEAEAAPASEEVALVRPEEALKAELVTEATQAQEALTEVTAFEIIDSDSMTFAADVLAETKGNHKRLDDKRKEITQPINAALKATNALFKPALDFYKRCEAGIKVKMLQANQRAQVAAQEALTAAGAAAAEGDTEALTQEIAAHDDAVNLPAADGIQYRTTWKFNIIDATLIPREFLTPDLKLIEGHVRHKKDATAIPGIEAYEDQTVASASK
ncbi:hypothetical protein LCGC14_0375000 [marine sediment metagenome]|uniref:Uncharacterized protein n=1 Tax=marine sediment metagenome TaxID=412755 RepID=A0A0F9WCM2_9ZZZZ